MAAALSMAPEGSSTSTTDQDPQTESMPNTDTAGESQDLKGEGAGVKDDDWDGEQMVPVPVDDSLLAQLVSMEFPEVKNCSYLTAVV